MNCPTLTRSKLDDFFDRILSRFEGGRYPLQGNIELTERCNNNCVHCYINKPVNDKKACLDELDIDEWCRIIDQIVEEGCLWLLITGGEPFLRKDLLDIYTYCKQKGLLVTLFSNGTLITPEIADYLAEWVPYNIEITLYGRSRQVYEKITRVPGSYDQCLNGIKLLLDRGLPLSLKTMVLRDNMIELQEMKQFSRELGLDFRYDMIVNPGFNKNHQPSNHRIPAEDAINIEIVDKERTGAWYKFAERYRGLTINSDDLYNCGGGRNTFHINAQGELSICMMSREPGYNLRDGSFKIGWRDAIPQVLKQKRPRESDCTKCNLQLFCAHCPTWSQLEHGDNETKVDYICNLTKLRVDALGLNLQVEESNNERDK